MQSGLLLLSLPGRCGRTVHRQSFRRGGIPRPSHHIIRTRRVFASVPVDKDEKNQDDPDTETDSSPAVVETAPVTRDSIRRLVELSRPEWALLSMSAATLGVTSSITLLLPYASGNVIDIAINPATSASSEPLMMAAGLFSLTAVSGFGVYLRTLWLSRAGNRIVARLRQGVYKSLLEQEMAFHDTLSKGDFLSRLSSDSQLIQSTVTTQAIAALRGLVVGSGSIAMLTYTSPTLAALSLCTLPPIFVASRTFGRELQKQQTIVQEKLADANTLAEQALGGISTVKQQFAAQEYEAHRYRNTVAEAHKTAVDTAHTQARLEGMTFVGANGAILGVLGYGGTLVQDGLMSAGDLTGFVMYSLFLAGNLSNMAALYADLSRAVAASDRVFAILDRKPQIPNGNTVAAAAAAAAANEVNDTDAPVSMDKADPAVIDGTHSIEIHNDDPLDTRVEWIPPTTVVTSLESRQPISIRIDNLSFAYSTRPENTVLGPGFSLSVEAGQVLALVGGSGSGKSTVAALLTRLYETPADTIFLNDRSLHDYPIHELRQHIGVVSQDPRLFRGTIADNIRYGQWTASDEDVERAARSAHVFEFVEKLPQGMETVVGPTLLSGGQKQRVAIARTLLQNPPLVILDEATSALDAHSEHLVQEAMDRIHQQDGRTVLSIAHRLSTIRHADVVAVLEDGRVVQQGPFDELANTKEGPFWNLMKTQLVDSQSK